MDTTADSFPVSPRQGQLRVVEGLSDKEAERLLAGVGQHPEA